MVKRKNFRYRDSTVTIVTLLWDGQSEVRTLVGAGDLGVLQNVQTDRGVPQASYTMGPRGLFPWR